MVPSIHDILTRRAPENPIKIDVASSTRTLSDTELEYHEDDQLSGIISSPNMLGTLIQHAMRTATTNIKLNAGDDRWISHVDPDFTHNRLTPVICSENDIREWSKTVWLRPALAIAHACQNDGRINFPYSSSMGGPHISSGYGKKGTPIPDDVLYKSLEIFLADTGSQNISQTYEYKTPMALDPSEFKKIRAEYPVIGIGNTTKRYVVPFIWPQKDSGIKINKSTKIIAQVYSQMITKKVNQAILTSYESTTFLYLKTIKQNNRDYKVMYMSATYLCDQPGTLAAVFAWVCLGLNILNEQMLRLPEADLSCVFERSRAETLIQAPWNVVGADVKYLKKYIDTLKFGGRKSRSHRPVSPDADSKHRKPTK